MKNETKINWFKSNWKKRKSMTLEDFTTNTIDLMIHHHKEIIKQLNQIKSDLLSKGKKKH